MLFSKKKGLLPYHFVQMDRANPQYYIYRGMVDGRNFPVLPWVSPGSMGAYPPMQHPFYMQESPSQLFQNPLEPYDEGQMAQHGYSPYPVMHPYPKVPFTYKPPSGFSFLLNSFKTNDGAIDVKKMIDTASQLIYAVNQMSSMIKGLGGMFKA